MIPMNCKIKGHDDRKASAIMNSGSSSYLPGSVKCLGCGKWYMSASPENNFNTYQELLHSLGEIELPKSAVQGEIIKYPRHREAVTSHKSHMKKSRKNYEGITLKSNLKSDFKLSTPSGHEYYPEKTPRVKSDYNGTHETVKEFFYDDAKNGSLDMSSGFFNRIAIDSDETGDILPRLKKISEISSVNGYWVILNAGNNKFQASINLFHTVINGHDLIKVKESARCINDICGDKHMTNGAMKNHKIKAKPCADSGLINGAQRTRTYGFDINLQNDFESYQSGECSYNWNNKWMKKIINKEIDIDFIDSKTGKRSRDILKGRTICFISPPKDLEFNIRKDKTWAISIEDLWVSTAVKYSMVKEDDGITYINESRSRMNAQNYSVYMLASNVLKDSRKSKFNSQVLIDSLKVQARKYCDYYKNSMIAYNNSKVQMDEPKEILDFKFMRLLLSDRVVLENFLLLIRSGSQNGILSMKKKDGLFKSWEKVANNRSLSKAKSSMLECTREQIEMVRALMPLLETYYSSDFLNLLGDVDLNKIPLNIRPFVSLANESTYYGLQHLVKGVTEEEALFLKKLSRCDYYSYRLLSIVYILQVRLNSSTNLKGTALKLKIRSEEILKELRTNFGIKKKKEKLKEASLFALLLDSQQGEDLLYYSGELVQQEDMIMIGRNTSRKIKGFNSRESESKNDMYRLEPREKIPPRLLLFVVLGFIIKQIIVIYYYSIQSYSNYSYHYTYCIKVLSIFD